MVGSSAAYFGEKDAQQLVLVRRMVERLELPVTIVAVREFLISVFRSFWGRRGLAVPATQWAKVKTVVQEVAVGFALLPLTADHRWVANIALWIAVVLTVTTGIHYVHAGSRATRTTGS